MSVKNQESRQNKEMRLHDHNIMTNTLQNKERVGGEIGKEKVLNEIRFAFSLVFLSLHFFPFILVNK